MTQTEIANARVTAIGSHGSYETHTDEYGDYFVGNLVPGEYLVEFAAAGYSTVTGPEPILVETEVVASEVWSSLFLLTGIAEGRREVRMSKFELFPNPVVSGFVTIRLSLPKAGPVAVTVFDIAGRAVLRQSAICGPQSVMTLDARRLATGVYLLRLDAEGYSTAQKFVVQR